MPDTTSVADRIYLQLREDIVRGELKPGQHLSVPSLAEQLNASRSPVREAVQRLTSDGLATATPRRGAVVTSIGLSDLVSLYNVREVLEGLAARLAVEHSGQRVVRALGEILDQHELAVQANDLDAHVELDLRFHSLLRQAGKNADVIILLDQIQAKVRLAMVSTTAVSGGPRLALADHKLIYKAVKAGDALQAEEAARQHIARLRKSLEAQLPIVASA